VTSDRRPTSGLGGHGPREQRTAGDAGCPAPSPESIPTPVLTPILAPPSVHRPAQRAGPVDKQRSGPADERPVTSISAELFALLRAAPPGSAAWCRHREDLVRRHLPLVHFLVRRFRGRGEPTDDLVQVATIGLIKAIDRFDVDRGVEFSTYATPTVVGEVKRHFRDRSWAVRVPRRMQEHMLAVSRATGELFGRLSRAPTVAEIAAYTHLTEEHVLEALGSAQAYATVSLDAGFGDGESGPIPVHPAAQDAQAALENVEHRMSLEPLLARLSPRERHIVMLRFFGNLTQSEIAAEIGVSQMHISRLLSRTLAQLREGLSYRE
jgi:RNA polymerase sigma-B factor